MDDNTPYESAGSHGSSTRTNPRRRPAEVSVSLRHSPRPSKQVPSQRSQGLKRNDSSDSSMEVDLHSAGSIQPKCTKVSSGESSNPEKWFEKSNNNVEGKSTVAQDDDPPFFIKRSSTENTFQETTRRQADQAQVEQVHTGANLYGAGDNGSEDFRSVIDDLTIENQRLKQRLRKFERMNSLVDTDALFEVRLHGLPALKKRELEEVLRDFVTKLGQTSHSDESSTRNKMNGSATHLPQHTSSTTSRVGDSGYHSISMSGQTSTRFSAQPDKKAQATAVANTELDNDIQNYLWDIPVGLQPQQKGPVSEKEKKKLIVRRLEQLFAGRDPSASGHQQPIQQQKLSQSAARADRRATQIAGDATTEEGSRIARIMPNSKTVLTPNAIQHAEENRGTEGSSVNSLGSKRDGDLPGLIEQRPTRPLDLDPYRAQVPAENMEYIRHLGFSPPHFDVEAQKDGHGWIYLNVLHNMAQLHLSNVTVDFVRKSILEYSQKLEISEDGRKLRWRGGASVTRTSSNNSPEHPEFNEDESTAHLGKLKHRFPAQQKNKHHLAYSPLFRRQESSSEDSGIYGGSNWLGATNTRSDYNTGIRNPQMAENPMIFYANAGFYTDLSADPAAQSQPRSGTYKRVSGKPIGIPTSLASSKGLHNLDSEKGPLSQLTLNLPQKPTDSLSSGSVEVIANSPYGSSSHGPDHVDFEVSGLGGVYPADNFAIDIKTRQHEGAVSDKSMNLQSMRRKAYPSNIRQMLQECPSSDASEPADQTHGVRTTRPDIQREIVSSNTKDLPASQLPEGNFFHESVDSDSDDEMLDYDSEEEDHVEQAANAQAVQCFDWATMRHPQLDSDDSSDGEEGDDECSNLSDHPDDQSEESMDLLAAARAMDPECVRRQEREFDSNVAERLAEELPAGSSAATAEGGSGHNSPNLTRSASTAHPSSGNVAVNIGSMGPPPTHQSRPVNLKRQRSSGDASAQRTKAIKSPRTGERK